MWYEAILEYINQVYPWFFAVTLNHNVIGVIWAENWNGFREHHYSVEIGGIAKRDIPVMVTYTSLQLFLKKLFDETEIYIMRGICDVNNRAAKLCFWRSGFSHPEHRRAWKLFQGKAVEGSVFSITRPEFELQMKSLTDTNRHNS